MIYKAKQDWMPRLGQKITPAQGVGLCNKLRLYRTAEHVANYLRDYKPFVFDGCSMVPDAALAYLTQDSGLWLRVIYNACLPHDLRYAYGATGDRGARQRGDRRFYFDLLDCGVDRRITRSMLRVVRLGGREWLNLPFSWGFARK